jgi:hypothetical protein
MKWRKGKVRMGSSHCPNIVSEEVRSLFTLASPFSLVSIVVLSCEEEQDIKGKERGVD